MARKHCEEIAKILDDRGVERETATLAALLMRKPARAEAMKSWLIQHPKATDSEIARQASEIARTVEPTKHMG